MSWIRPEAQAALRRWREPALAALFAAFGVWLALRGGPFFGALGSLAVGVGLGLTVSAWRRLRFAASQTPDPGVVQIDEGAIAYFSPEMGGVVALSELSGVEVLTLEGVPAWRLRQADGLSVTIPMAAIGADRLIDVFAALPGARLDAFVAARQGASAGAPRTLWRRDPARRLRALPRP